MAEQKKRVSQRTPFNGHRNVLTAKGKEDGYFYRFVNDVGDRVDDLKEQGYEVVTHDIKIGDRRVATSKQVGSPVVTNVGGGIKGVLMRIKNEWRDEDDARKAKIVDDTEETLRNPPIDGKYGKIDLTR